MCSTPTCDTCEDKDMYNFMAFEVAAFTLFLLLNKELNFNYFYTSVEDIDIDTLYKIVDALAKINEYCNACN